jgi:uncharacterized membrane protein HdeD (DUF308 family)
MKNYYYLIVGLLVLLLEIPRTLNGLEATMTFHIIGTENLVIGITLIIMAFQKKMEQVKFTAWLIITILLARWAIISFFTVLDGDFMVLVVDTIAIFTLVTLLFFGTRVKNE